MLSGTPTFSVSALILLWGRTSERGCATFVPSAFGGVSQQARCPARRLARNPARRDSWARRAKRFRKKHVVACHSASSSFESRNSPRRAVLQKRKFIHEDRSADAFSPRPRNQHRSAKPVVLTQSSSSILLAPQTRLASFPYPRPSRLRRTHT